MEIKIQLYPNSEVRATFFPSPGVRGYWEEGAERGSAVAQEKQKKESEVPLDITLKLSEAKKPGFGGIPRATKFGNNGRRTISRCAGVFDTDGIPPEEFLLLTGTIPGSTDEAFEAVARWSSWAVKTIKTWVSDRGVRDAYSMYVWEFQKRGALHIHYCVHIADLALRGKILGEWKKRWTDIIDEICSKSGCDVWGRGNGKTWATNKGVIQADAQVIRKSVGAYLSKYLSKNAPTNEAKPLQGQRFYGPVRWWGCSRPLLKRCRELSEEFRVECVGVGAIRYLKEKVFEIMNWSESRVHSYWDKVRSTNVLLTYSKEECQSIFSYLKRDLFKWQTAPGSHYWNHCQASNTLRDSLVLSQQGSDSSKSVLGQRLTGVICQSSLF